MEVYEVFSKEQMLHLENKLLINHFEKKLDVSNQISNSFLKFPYTEKYDCSSNFAPVTLFDIKDIEKN